MKGVEIAGKSGTSQVVRLKYTEGLEDDEIPLKHRDHGWVAEGADPVRTIQRYRDTPAKRTVILSAEQCEALLRACREPYVERVKGTRNAGGRKGKKTTKEVAWTQTKYPPGWLYP